MGAVGAVIARRFFAYGEQLARKEREDRVRVPRREVGDDRDGLGMADIVDVEDYDPAVDVPDVCAIGVAAEDVDVVWLHIVRRGPALRDRTGRRFRIVLALSRIPTATALARLRRVAEVGAHVDSVALAAARRAKSRGAGRDVGARRSLEP